MDNATLFWKPWFEEGVVTVKDVLNPEGNFLSYKSSGTNLTLQQIICTTSN